MKLSLGFSPCPNDTFLFDALIHGKINSGDFEFDVHLNDVEALNQKALVPELDITKISYHAFAYANQHYVLLNSGSALGRNCGPLLISKQDLSLLDWNQLSTKVNSMTIAIPGKLTTANFLFGIAFSQAEQKKAMQFNEIEDAVLNGRVDAGVIIHENRFTYAKKGLKKIIDLGAHWETLTGLPIPLGGIALRRTLPHDTQVKVQELISQSVRFAFENPDSSYDYVKSLAQEMEKSVMYRHINLYVNQFTENLGENGRMAVETLYRIASERHLIPELTKPVFVE